MTTLPVREANNAMQTCDKCLLQGRHALPDIKLTEGSSIVKSCTLLAGTHNMQWLPARANYSNPQGRNYNIQFKYVELKFC